MTDTFRAMCAELVDSLENARRIIQRADGTLHINTAEFVLRRARALLAEPEAEGPSADEWDALVKRAWDEYETVGYLGERFMYDSDFCNALDFVRRELARWGRPAAAPVPVSERPWERQDWCDKDGRCWFGWADEPDASWSLCKPSERDTATVSLPANALPTYEVTND